MRNQADSLADLERFCKRIAEAERLYFLDMGSGALSVESNEYENQDGEASPVLLFFSDAAYAKRAQKAFPSPTSVEKLQLFNFLYRWLPGMSGDGCLAGPNWTGDLVGVEIDPFELREKVEAFLNPEQTARHKREYELQSGAET